MAGTIEYDTEGGTFTAGVDGNQWDRPFAISGLLAGGDPLNPSIPDLIDEAFVLVPNTGSAAPSPIANMFVRSSTFTRFWCENQVTPSWGASGNLIYTTPASVGGSLPYTVPDANGPGITLSTSSGIQEIDVYYDKNGVQLTTTNDGVVQAHRGIGFAAVSTHTFTRVEDVHPRARQDTFIGKVNSAPWNGYAAFTVLCANIEVRSDDGENWITTYTFEVKPTWAGTFIHDDPFYPGNPIPLSEADPSAVLNADTVPDVSFASLNITLP